MATPELPSPMDKKAKFNLWYWIAAFLLLLGFQAWYAVYTQVEPLPYSEFQKHLRDGKIEEIAVSANDIRGKFKTPLETGELYFVTTRVEPDLARELDRFQVRYAGRVQSTLLRDVLSWILPAVIFVGVWYWLGRRLGGGTGLLSIGKSRAKVYVEADTGVTFDDVAGVDEARAELFEVVDYLKNPTRYERLGGRMPKGVLLVGPPGTGKTLLAKAVAGEAKVPFFSISGSEFVEMFVGVGAARVRDLFEQARLRAPCIIFIDELDALGRARTVGVVGGHDEKEQTLNQLLVEMDGFDTSSGVVILAATNRPEILDPALLRAGRFDRQVLVDRPDKLGRAAILGVHLRRVPLSGDADAQKIAELTPGFTGAELANLVNEAALLATRRGSDAVEMRDFTEAVERIIAGPEKRNRLLSPKEREVVAYHELGHATVALSLPGADPVHKVSIIPRGVGALGYTIQRPTEDRFLMTRQELENKMTVLLGGRAAESLIFGHLSTGAADDLAKATDIARAMVTRYGMSERLGHVVVEPEAQTFLGSNQMRPADHRRTSESLAAEIDVEVRQLVQAAFDRASSILEEREQRLRLAAERLLEKETLDQPELLELVAVDHPGGDQTISSMSRETA